MSVDDLGLQVGHLYQAVTVAGYKALLEWHLAKNYGSFWRRVSSIAILTTTFTILELNPAFALRSQWVTASDVVS